MGLKQKIEKCTYSQIEYSLRLKARIKEIHERNIIRGVYNSNSEVVVEKFSDREWKRLLEPCNNPTYFTLCKLAIYLRVPLSELFKFDFKKKIKQIKTSPYWIIEGDWRFNQTDSRFY